MLSLSPASVNERIVIENLMQLYAYDWTEIRPADVGDNGRFEDYPLEAYWQEDWRHPFLLRVEGKLAGFALVAERSRLSGKSGVFDMAEFFVLRRFRRSGVGLAAATALFDRFQGPWEVRERPANLGGIAFWRRAIAHYTGGKFQDVEWNDAAWIGQVQTFSSLRR